MDRYIPELEGLRAVLAWWVVIGHVANFSGYLGDVVAPWWLQPILRTGVPVHVFIILSGFVIFYLLDRNTAYAKFMIGRVFRIVPVYLLCFFLATALVQALHQPLLDAPWSSPALRAEHGERLHSLLDNLWTHVLLHLTLLHGMVPDQVLPHSGHAFLGPAWSLTLEWQFYLVAPFLLRLCRRAPLTAALVFGTLLLFKLVLLRSGLTFSFGAFLPLKIEYFLLGIGTFFAFKRSRAAGFAWRPWLELGAGIALAFVVMFFTGGMREHFFAVAIWVVVVAAAVAHMRGLAEGNWLAQWLRTPFMRYLGRISYPTYLLHVIVIDLLGAVFVRVAPADLSRVQVMALMLAPSVLATWAASHLMHRYIEAPAMQWGRSVQERSWRARVEKAA